MLTITQRREVKALFGVTFLIRSASIIVQTLTPIILIRMFSMPETSIGWLIAGFWIANAFGALVAIGIIRNRRISTLGGLGILAGTFIGIALFQNVVAYGMCVVLSGFGLSIVQTFLVPSMYASSRGEAERPHSGIGTYATALSLGTIVGPLSAAATIFLYGSSTLFIILSAVSVTSFALCAIIGVQKSYGVEDTLKGIMPSTIIRTFKKDGFKASYLLNFLYSMLFPILLSYGGVYAEEHFGISVWQALLLFTATFAISTAIRILFSRHQIRSFRSLVVLGFMFLLVSFALIGIASNFPVFLIGFLLFSVPHALIYPALVFMSLEFGGREGIMSTTYLFATSSGAAEFLAPLLVVPIITVSTMSWIFVAMAPIALVGALYALRIPNPQVDYSH